MVVVSLLLLFGVLSFVLGSFLITKRIDADLSRLAQAAAKIKPPHPPGHQDAPDDGRPGIDRPEDPNQHGPPRRDPYEQADQLAVLRRPRIFQNHESTARGPQKNAPFDADGLAKAWSGVSNYSTIDTDDGRARIYSLRTVDGQQRDTVVQVARELDDVDLLRGVQLYLSLVLLPFAVALSAVAAIVITRRLLKPVQAMTRIAARLNIEHSEERLSASGDDEFGELASTFNGMIDRLRESYQQVSRAYQQLEKSYEDQRRFTADASHELRTPLTRMQLATGNALLPGATSEERDAALRSADKAASRMATLVDQLLLLARSDAGQLALPALEIDLRVAVAEALDVFDNERIHADFSDHQVMVRGDATHLARVVKNLVENALRYSEGSVEISVREEGGKAILEVADHGPGVNLEELPKLTERFYRVEASRSEGLGGAGLGLSLVADIVKAYGGELRLQSEAGRYFSATVHFLAVPPQQ